MKGLIPTKKNQNVFQVKMVHIDVVNIKSY